MRLFTYSFICLFVLAVGGETVRGGGGPQPVGTAFTYQGKLTEGDSPPASLDADIKFRLFDDEAAGTQVGTEFVASNVILAEDGTFTVDLDFGKAFPGEKRWLEIEVRSPAGAKAEPFHLLSPRQPVMPSPYALIALDVVQSPVVGTWVLTVESGVIPAFEEILVLHEDGTISETNSTVHAHSASPEFNFNGSDGYGFWVATGEESADFKFAKFVYDGTTNDHFGYLVVQGSGSVTKGSFSSSAIVNIFIGTDLNNPVKIIPLGKTTASGERMQFH